MGLFRKFVNNTRKPEGLLGSIMIWGDECRTCQNGEMGDEPFSSDEFKDNS